MLKKFLLNTLSSFVGTWIAILLLGVVGVIVTLGIIGTVATSEISNSVKKHSVLVLDLKGSIIEAETPTSLDYTTLLAGDIEKPQTLNVIVEGLREAENNDNIDALYIKCGNLSASPATVNAIRDAVIKFKKSGKKVYAYGDNYTLGTYYVASVSDKIFLNPYGEVAIQGLGSTSMFFKGLLDRLGIQFQVVKVGTFKSAVEPYISDKMSEPARAQLDTLFTVMWDFMKDGICKNRKSLTPVKIDSLVNRGLLFSSAEKAMKGGFVDETVYERTMDERIAKLINVEKDKLNYVDPATLVGEVPWTDAYSSKNCIAVLYATGEIVDGDKNAINYQSLVPVITKLADDDNVKGLVLRVNSPGGSAYGSDQIGEALDYFKSKKKPLAVSMGDYAASGGYWISCGGDRIFADPLTITGSIGIFGLIPNGKGLADKLGIGFETVSTNPDANFPNLYSPMTDSQLVIMQNYVNEGYERFINRVAKGRKMKPSAVKRIAEGRVWNAMTAQKIGLVDQLGSLYDAIEWTAKKADVYTKYDIAAYPVFEPSFWDLIPTADMETVKAIRAIYDGDVNDYGVFMAKKILQQSRIQARMPEFRVIMGN